MSPVHVNCPTCQRELDWETGPFRPFCSDRCRLIDLGGWLSERHAIAGDPADPVAGGEPPGERSSEGST